MKTRLTIIILTLCLCFMSACAKTSSEECVYLNERANLHEEYIVSVSEIGEMNTIFIYKNKEDVEKSEIIGTTSHYLYVKLMIEHQNVASSKEEHKLGASDFKIKDHTGVKLGDVTFIESLKTAAKSQVNFSTKKALEDYEWADTQVQTGTSKELILYFEFEKTFDVENILMVLEVDFFASKKGTDIVLINRVSD